MQRSQIRHSTIPLARAQVATLLNFRSFYPVETAPRCWAVLLKVSVCLMVGRSGDALANCHRPRTAILPSADLAGEPSRGWCRAKRRALPGLGCHFARGSCRACRPAPSSHAATQRVIVRVRSSADPPRPFRRGRCRYRYYLRLGVRAEHGTRVWGLCLPHTLGVPAIAKGAARTRHLLG